MGFYKGLCLLWQLAEFDLHIFSSGKIYGKKYNNNSYDFSKCVHNLIILLFYGAKVKHNLGKKWERKNFFVHLRS
jgi:hypothetical protein